MKRNSMVWKISFPIMLVLGLLSCKPDNENELRGRIGAILEKGKTWYVIGCDRNDGTLQDPVYYLVDYRIEKNVDTSGRWYVDYHWLNGKDYTCTRFQQGSGFFEYEVGYRQSIFSFDASKGDVLMLEDWWGNYNSVYVRDVFDTVLPGGDGKMRRAMLVENGDVWVEDIGSLTYGIRQREARSNEPQWQLIGCEKDGEWYYKHPSFDAFMELVQDTTGRH